MSEQQLNKPQMVDSHCHLDFESFDNDREQVLQRAADNNISDIVIPGTRQVYWQRIKTLSKQYTQLHACYGLHPYWVNQHRDTDLQCLTDYIETNRPVALGECGLDFRKQQADKKTQLFFFEAQLDIAAAHQLPVVIHSVNATEDVIRSIKKYNISGMIHSYSGSSEQARQLVDLNFYISISGSVTYGNAKKIRGVARDIPLSALLLETDAPDQPDKENAGKRNEPAFLINTLKTIAELREQPAGLIAEHTTENAKKLFGI